MRLWATAGLVAFGLIQVSLAHADTRPVARATSGGKEIRLTVHSDYGATCQGGAKPKISVVSGPKSGSVALRDSIEIVNKPGNACHGRQIGGVGVFYKPHKGFKGEDRVVYDRLSASGQPLFRVDATIRVD